MKKLFVVTTEVELIILAEDRAEAEKVADSAMARDYGVTPGSWTAQPMTYIPGDWDTACVPFEKNKYDGNDNLLTIAELIEQGHAPEYRRMRDLLAKAGVRDPKKPEPESGSKE